MDDSEAPAAAGGSRPRAGRSRRRLLVGAAVILVAVLIGWVVVRWIRGTAREVDLADVTTSTGTALESEPSVLRPPAGVYEYTGEGTDRIDKPPRSQAQGPSMPATVTHRGDGCWTFRIDYSTNHWQSWDYCPEDGGLVEVGGQTYQRWDFGAFANETTSTFECVAPTILADQSPGDEWAQSCTGGSTGVEGTTTSAGEARFVGTETLEIGGREVDALRYHRERTNTGNQSGSEVSEVWFDAETGMPLRNERSLEASSDTVIGRVDYTEQGSFELESLEPRR
ncbi:MAG: hypothetical protein R2716_05095 [Microthrixaceae bacterium]